MITNLPHNNVECEVFLSFCNPELLHILPRHLCLNNLLSEELPKASSFCQLQIEHHYQSSGNIIKLAPRGPCRPIKKQTNESIESPLFHLM